jgi:hypothetical protein
MMRAFVTEAIGDSISLPVKLLLRTAYDYALQSARPWTSMRRILGAQCDGAISLRQLAVRRFGR